MDAVSKISVRCNQFFILIEKTEFEPCDDYQDAR
jgi:hypothetical protein